LLEVSPFLQKNLSELSSGQQQIVNILVSLANWSEILVLDEPFANLDLRRVGKLASHLLREKKDFIVTTHVPEEAEMIGEHFIVLEGGNVVWSGSIRDLITSDIFEVFMNGESNSLNIIYRFGNIALVKNSEEELYKFLREGLIYGFRKAGVRKFYGLNPFSR
jgi:ABC-type cobalamin/Fe3+-siderophores transport systems, ATPase components